MKTLLAKLALILLSTYFLLGATPPTNPTSLPIRGIYVTQTSLEDTAFIKYLIKNSQDTGINTFVIDMDIPSKLYARNIKLVIDAGIKYVARVVMFPGGGTTEQVNNEGYWQRKYKLVKAAQEYGASEIQLDYIRYDTHRPASPEHAKNIYKIISWYKKKLAADHIPLQIDVFGISSFKPEEHIGQNIPFFADTIDALCPMVYPSHYTPFKEHFNTPYETVYDSLMAIKDQFPDKMPIKLIPYIELSNYHFSLSQTKKFAYIRAQIQATQDAEVDGWYAWSPNNYYESLFTVLAQSNNTPKK